jgi:hypothetical protein
MPKSVPRKKRRESRGRALVVATPEFKIQFAEPVARRWLKQFFGRPARAELLPATHSRQTVSGSRILLRCHRSELVGNQLPACRTLYPNIYAAVLATCLFAAVLTFDGYPAGRHRHVSVNPHFHVLLFAD